MSHRTSLLLALAATLAAPAGAQLVTVDPSIAPYQKTTGVGGNINSIGSDTMVNLMTLWGEGFQKNYPGVRIQVEGKGSSTAPPALIAGTAQLGPMSREMKATEVDQFEAKFGYPPLQFQVAVDALAVYVHKDNPLEQLTLAQVDAIFSKTRNCGAPKDFANWAELGLSGPWTKRPISMYGRNSASGTYGYFKTAALCEGDYKDTVKEQPGSASVVQGITEDIAGIGYSGIGYRTSGVKTIQLAKKEGGPYANTDTASVLSGDYPLARMLYVYINRKPGAALDPLTREFLKFVLSSDGQQTVIKDGYLPLPADVVTAELAKLQ
ncbi:MAG TPA: phosphate ABC transporter substrate-binding protein [Terriglobales bacterium]|nr:phosphate ABC transporter substrate-binding protein [Terriglobales bacterium]